MHSGKSAAGLSRLPGALLRMLGFAVAVPAQAWVHPGIVVSPDQLAATRAAYQAGNSVIVDQVSKARDSDYGSLSYTAQGPVSGGINQCGSSSNPNKGCQSADNDSNAAYVQALLWYMTGNQTYANNAIAILNTYASHFRGYAGTNGLSCPSGTDCSNGPLQSGWDAEKWPRAAEIIRYGTTSSGAGSGWSAASITAFSNMLKNVYQPVIQNGSTVNGNWDMSMIDGTMQIAVFTESSALLATARTLWKGRVPDLYYLQSVDGSNHAASPRGNPSWFGQSIFNATTTNVAQETCRDLRHTEDSIAPSDYCTGSGASDENQIVIGPGATYVIGYNAYHNRLNVAAMADASGTNGLHGTANTYNWIQNGLLPQSLSSDQGNHMTLFEALTHTVEVCKTATSAWTNTSFTAQTGSPTVKFNATPSGNNINAVMGLSDGPQSVYTSLAAIVRFNPSGFIDAYNGTGYSALTSIPLGNCTRPSRAAGSYRTCCRA